MDQIEVTDEVLAGLAAKLKGLELSEEEQAVLGTILSTSAASQAEVQGYGVVFEVETTFKGTDEELQALLRRASGKRVWTDMRPLGFNIGMPPK